MISDKFTPPASLREGSELLEAKNKVIADIFRTCATDGVAAPYDYSKQKTVNGKPAEDYEVAAHQQALIAEVEISVYGLPTRSRPPRITQTPRSGLRTQPSRHGNRRSPKASSSYRTSAISTSIVMRSKLAGPSPRWTSAHTS